MPIDYTKLLILDFCPDKLLNNNPLLSFFDKVESSTGLLGKYKIAKYRGLLFKVYYGTETNNYQRRITIEGSLHKYWNNGKHNFNDFGINELKNVLNDLELKFGINPTNCYINQIEIGINLKVPFIVHNFLNNCIMHKKKRFKWHKTKGKGHFLIAEYQRYNFKVYDKATRYKNLNYQINDEILRIEIKYRNLEDLRTKYKIFYLEDLLNFGLEKFIPILIEKWEEVIFFEDEVFANTKDEMKYNNVNFWENLKAENYKYHRKEMIRKIKKSNINTKSYISKLIEVKANELLKTT